MKKIKILSPIIFYIAFFIINLFTATMVTFGGANPNLSSYLTFGNFFFSLLGNGGFLLLLFCLVCMIFKKTRTRCNLLLMLTIIFTILCMFLDVFQNMFSMFFDYSQLSSFKNPTQGALIMEYVTYILGMLGHGSMIVLYFPMLIMIILRFFIDPFHNKKYVNFSYKIATSFISLIFMVIPLIIMNCSAQGSFYSISMNGLYGCSHAGVYNYYLYNLNDKLFGKKISLTEENAKICQEFLELHPMKHREIEYTDMGKEKNLVLIQMEAINNFVIDLEVNGTLIAPNLTNLAHNNLYYDRFYSSSGIGNTSDCEFATLTGLYPNGNDLSVFTFEGEHYETMPKDFANLGYATFSIHGNDGKFYNRDIQHVETLGFQKHIDREDLLERNPELSLVNGWIGDYDLLQESVKIFKEQTTNFFAYDILVSSHSPFVSSDAIPHYKYPGVSRLASDYLDYVRYVDSAIGQFITAMKENDLLNDTIIMIYADHTSQLLKSDLESLLKEKLDNVTYRLKMQNVPLIIMNPIFDISRSSYVFSQVDLYPTIANLFGLPTKYKFGADILNKEKTYAYSPRNLDLIFKDYVIMYPSKTIYYTNPNAEELSKKEVKQLCAEFAEYKYYNDLLLATEYFK